MELVNPATNTPGIVLKTFARSMQPTARSQESLRSKKTNAAVLITTAPRSHQIESVKMAGPARVEPLSNLYSGMIGSQH